MIALTAFEIVLLIAFAPLKIAIDGYFCLGRSNLMIDFKFFAMTVVRFRVEKQQNEFVVKINDKQIDLKNKKNKMSVIKNVFNYATAQKITIKGNILAVLGDKDPMMCALLTGAVLVIAEALGANITTYNDFSAKRVDAEFLLKSKINIVQVVDMLTGESV